jgi:hypothetical protein
MRIENDPQTGSCRLAPLRAAVVALLTLTVAAACASAPREPVPAPTDLAGVWVLNEAHSSDDSRLRIEPYPHRIPGSEPVDSLPELLGGFRAAELVRTLAAVRAAADTIIIDQRDGALALRRPGGRTLALSPGSRSGEQVWLNALPSNVRARWQDQRLVVEHRGTQNVRVTEYYSRSIDRQQLVVFTTVRGTGMHEYSVRRVYDLAQAVP